MLTRKLLNQYLPVFLAIIFSFLFALQPLWATTANGFIMMSTAETDTQINTRELIARQALAWQNADAEAIIADWSEDAVFVVPGAVFRGKPAIKAAAEAYFAKFTDTQITIKRIITEGDQGVVEWTWRDRDRTSTEQNTADDAIIFELEDGKIVYWREYIDTQTPSTQSLKKYKQ